MDKQRHFYHYLTAIAPIKNVIVKMIITDLNGLTNSFKTKIPKTTDPIVLTVLIITITIQRGKDFNEYQERKPPKALTIKPNISSLLNIRFFIVNEIILSKPFFIL